ncbi:hypothetical protein SEQ01_06620 [Streptococcus equinus]|uniref:hypothetical protein n=1 Tax=Streptococcus equinus TaxID=1335 RepID=UPI0011440F66|nr:hypothetical protein [Streptococcus equinus]GEB10471.1 hypothetical protein SEQ01_06620 [Streptococcus equinus]
MSIEKIFEDVIKTVPKINSSSDYWLVRSNSGEFFTDFNINSYIGIAWNEISLNDIKSANNDSEILKNTLRKKLKTDNGQEISEQSYGSIAGQLLRFVNKIKVNDIVVVPSEHSESFIVGKVVGHPYEDTINSIPKEKESGDYHRSNYIKRIKVKWINRFNRSDADSALYKMIYTHNTLSDINDYKPFINRALYRYYIEDDKLYISFKVTESDDISSESLGQFIYQYSLLNRTLFPDNRLDVKTNVQSPGDIEFISHTVEAGMTIFAFIATGGVIIFGGKVTIFGKSFEAPGIISSFQSYKNKKRNEQIATDEAQLKLIEKAAKLSQELQVPISTLGIEVPDKLEEALKAAARTPNDGEENN